MNDKTAGKKYRRIRQHLKYSCESIIPFTRSWSSHRQSTRRQAITKAIESVPEFLLCLHLTYYFVGFILMLLCQTQIRNDNRNVNAQRRKAGETIKRGRKAKPKLQECNEYSGEVAYIYLCVRILIGSCVSQMSTQSKTKETTTPSRRRLPQ